MKETKYYIAFDRYERGKMINALNEMRNRLIAKGRYTDAVDELIIKICGDCFYNVFNNFSIFCAAIILLSLLEAEISLCI